jgi:FkbM family methyltransferase
MDVKEALLGGLMGAQPQAEMSDAINGLSKKLDQLIKLADDQVHLSRVALLEPGHILRFFSADGQQILLALPEAQDDYVQRVILRTRTFFEAKLLSMIHGMNLIDPASTVCDIGANIGNHTVYFGKMMGVGRVLCFEPQPACYATLTTNIDLNGLSDHATAYNCLVGAVTGNGRLARFNSRNLGGTAFEQASEGTIPMFALDDVITADDLATLDLIKIDVEGMQGDVLKGAEGVLDARKPALWVEILERDRAYAETAAFLGRFGYKAEKLGPNDFMFRV